MKEINSIFFIIYIVLNLGCGLAITEIREPVISEPIMEEILDCTLNKYKENSPYANSGLDNIDGKSSETAFSICTIEQFNSIGKNSSDWNKYFILSNDIDFNNLSEEYVIIANFSGNFDGRNFNISNFTYSNPSAINYALFQTIEEEGIIKNLNLVDVNISGAEEIAGLAVTNNGLISNCSVLGFLEMVEEWNSYLGGLIAINNGYILNSSANITLNAHNNYYVGGLVGYNWGYIANSFTKGSITGIESDSQDHGGFVGSNGTTGTITGTIENSYSSVDVSAAYYVGGFAGSSFGIINNSFSTGNVTATQGWGDVGFFVGNDSEGILNNCYYNASATCTDGGDACNTRGNAAPNLDYFYNITLKPMSLWDFDKIWKEISLSFPILH